MYHYKLQAVLDYRKMIEDHLKKELSEIREKIALEEDLLNALKRKEMKTIRALKKEQDSGISSYQVVAYHTYLDRLLKRMAEKQALVDELRTEETRKHENVLEAVKKRKMLDRLKSKGVDRYRQMILDQETKFIDEIAVNQFARKSIEIHGENE